MISVLERNLLLSCQSPIDLLFFRLHKVRYAVILKSFKDIFTRAIKLNKIL